ncbi:orc1/cdc6 family replication initiation protein (plasmid) [Halorussus limi]|uniref:Orc1/cdc6 family replication initiation protein n=1 Tax=Halorussus limi TaxID=2938695 RepID=A0A8U0I0Z5_9EURY|nr:Cdc6/Cdc18 family protein [Halorussus limi]UPV76877.1 orc1/cdc6 family replication initiation protein [Halorussus limi]
MITDARVLRTGFVPREVEHRDAEVTHLTEVLAPLTDGDPADTTLLLGPSGVGKTCLAKYTAEQLRQEVLDVEYQYVNCWQNFSEFRTLYRILEGLGKTIDIHRQSTPRDELFERLRTYDGPPCVVILDEADQLEQKRLLYTLHELPQFSMLLIANRERELFANADERLTSRLTGCERVRFDRYDSAELVSIMDARVKRGLEENAVERDQLATIADAAAGDARVALSVLRTAARQAHQSYESRITDEIVEASIPEARAERHEKDVDTLTPHQHTLYEIIEDHDAISPSELYEEYRERTDDPKTDRTVRNYLSKMDQYDVIEAEGTSRDRTYRSVSETFDRIE